MNKYTKANLALWEGWTDINKNSGLYRLDEFKAGKNVLKSIELDELPDVSGKSMLHLQCHFGMDTLSWARMGADITGIDFSPKAIALAKSLSEECSIPARFIRSELFDLPNVLDEEFDIVFTSYGVLTWLGDIEKWAEIVARYLKPGGIFYMVEFHPLFGSIDDDGENLKYPYFYSPEPMKFNDDGNYADPDADFKSDSYEWSQSIGEVVTALIKAGLKIEFLHEFPYSTCKGAPCLVESEPRRFVLEKYPGLLPLVYSVRATKPSL
ncbi:MAG: class I SAM-dependent methyltransferase [candidate division Zixibacteria bacterium]